MGCVAVAWFWGGCEEFSENICKLFKPREFQVGGSLRLDAAESCIFMQFSSYVWLKWCEL